MAKFKVGDKVRVREDLVGDSYYERNDGNGYCGRKLYCNHGMTQHAGKIFTIRKVDEYAGEYELEGICWYWSDDMLEPVPFTKADLKDGMVVEVRNNTRNPRYMVLNGKLRGTLEYMDLMNFNDDLTHTGDYERLDIVKVYKSGGDILNKYFHDGYLTLIWERKEEPEHKEMTVAEIEEKLGYKIKVVGEKE